ncbi:hypothetical protein BDP27DRAFT_1429534 [Rhodocollybia butyracea]|uniref:Nephrocystin 3-like N-terminal domain-containing protein n=1 Tax=Rhodocollybia butyracea TaxID=206335 RepID=A0A9P5PBN3_9AGAR|nr:hypothetical protein BDP27DRAFT_1429534 [Rhodocollybia butyracea]
MDYKVCPLDHTTYAISLANLKNSPTIQGTDYFCNRHLRSDGYCLPQPATAINDCTLMNHTRQSETGIDKLRNVAALEALYNSTDSFSQPRCLPGTCTEILTNLQEWSLQTDPARRIKWLSGPAGAGKEPASSEVPSFSDDPILDLAIFATIAYQLALNVPWLGGPISQVLEQNPSVVIRSVETQLQNLISEPCRMHPNQTPLTILIDGLDECEGQDVHLEILRAIRNSSTERFFPLKFIIASRPKVHIRRMFESSVYHSVLSIMNLNVCLLRDHTMPYPSANLRTFQTIQGTDHYPNQCTAPHDSAESFSHYQKATEEGTYG